MEESQVIDKAVLVTYGLFFRIHLTASLLLLLPIPPVHIS
jgi:hypothetical protein